jgi:hypothetical protein
MRFIKIVDFYTSKVRFFIAELHYSYFFAWSRILRFKTIADCRNAVPIGRLRGKLPIREADVLLGTNSQCKRLKIETTPLELCEHPKHLNVIHLSISRDEMIRRASLKGKDDDSMESIYRRFDVYVENVHPSLGRPRPFFGILIFFRTDSTCVES